MSIDEDLRKLVLAGLGAASVAAEKTGETIDALAKHGEEVLAQGKDINQRLRHEIQKVIKDTEKPVTTASGKDEVMDALDKLSPEERKAVREKLEQLDQNENA